MRYVTRIGGQEFIFDGSEYDKFAALKRHVEALESRPALTREQIEDAAASLFITDGGLEGKRLDVRTEDNTNLQSRTLSEVVDILCVHLMRKDG